LSTLAFLHVKKENFKQKGTLNKEYVLQRKDKKEDKDKDDKTTDHNPLSSFVLTFEFLCVKKIHKVCLLQQLLVIRFQWFLVYEIKECKAADIVEVIPVVLQ
jgi:hypothetical protein